MTGRIAVALSAVLLTTGCTVTIGNLPGDIGLEGSGVVVEEEREVDEFTEIDVSSAFEVKVAVGEEQRVLVRTDDNILPLVETEVSGGRLRVGLEEHTMLVDADTLEIEIGVPHLEYLGLSGAAQADVEGVDAEEFGLEVSGASRVTAHGKVDELDVEASGASSVRALDLEARTGMVDASGASEVQVAVVERVEITASGASSVCYLEGPIVTQDASGASTIEACD